MKNNSPKPIPFEKRSAKQPFLIAGCLVSKDGKFLLVKEDGKYNLPQGWVRLGEDIQSAAKRETAEETGCSVRLQNLLGVYTLIKDKTDKTLHAVKFIFTAKMLGSYTKKEEGIETAWLSTKEIKKLTKKSKFWDLDVPKIIKNFQNASTFPKEIIK